MRQEDTSEVMNTCDDTIILRNVRITLTADSKNGEPREYVGVAAGN
jgi:hypothetical protein